MQKSMFRKGLVIGIIVLFVGIAVAPGITANNSLIKKRYQLKLNEETVDFTVEVCGLNGEKQTVELTKEEAEEVEHLFNSIRKKLDETETKEEAEVVFKEAVIELDKYGLLGDLSIKQAQQLVTGKIGVNSPDRLKSNKYYNLVYHSLKNKNSKQNEDENNIYLIAGDTTNTTTIGIWSIFSGIFGISLFALGTIIEILLEMVYLKFLRLPINWLIGIPALFLLFTSIFSYVFPLKFGGPMIFGSLYWPGIKRMYHPAEGWVFTIGLNGIKTWNGSLYGNIKKISNGFEYYYLGAVGFTGIKISPFGSGFYLGAALRVNLSHDPL